MVIDFARFSLTTLVALPLLLSIALLPVDSLAYIKCFLCQVLLLSESIIVGWLLLPADYAAWLLQE